MTTKKSVQDEEYVEFKNPDLPPAIHGTTNAGTKVAIKAVVLTIIIVSIIFVITGAVVGSIMYSSGF